MDKENTNQTRPRIMVDMAVTLIHHGHIRCLQKAAEHGDVVVALTTDEEVLKTKGYLPELKYAERKEILESIRYVKEVVPAPWIVDEPFLDKYHCDMLAHPDNTSVYIAPERLLIIPRTEGISSSQLREYVLNSLIGMNINEKTPGASEKLAIFLINLIKKEFRME